MPKFYPLGPVMLDVAGLALDAAEREVLAHPQVGGVILFTRNYDSPEQLIGLTRKIREARPDIIISVDHEGGRVQRFRQGFTRIPSMHALASKEPALLKPTAQLMALELMAVGIDFTFAPVLDRFNPASQVIGDRAFAEKPEHIAPLASQFIAGLVQEGMAAIGKHFPGHGGVAEDTHIEAASDQRDWHEIEATDLQPFTQLAPQLAGVMPAHVSFPAVCEHPVGFSPYWLQTVLREKLKFSGVIFSDDLSMVAAAALGEPLVRGQAALEAGCDVILLCNAPNDAIALIEGLENNQEPSLAFNNLQESSKLMALSAREKRAQTGFNWQALQASKFYQTTQTKICDFLEALGSLG